MPSLVCHLAEDGLYGLLCGHARNIKLIQHRRDLRAAVSQNSQRRDNVVHGSARLNLRRRYAYLRNTLVYLILQLKNNTLRNLLADPGRDGKRLFVVIHYRQRQPLRRIRRENGQRGLGAETGNGEQKLKAAPLVLIREAIEVEHLVADYLGNIQLGFISNAERGERIMRHIDGVAHAAAVDDRKIRFRFGNDAA